MGLRHPELSISQIGCYCGVCGVGRCTRRHNAKLLNLTLYLWVYSRTPLVALRGALACILTDLGIVTWKSPYKHHSILLFLPSSHGLKRQYLACRILHCKFVVFNTALGWEFCMYLHTCFNDGSASLHWTNPEGIDWNWIWGAGGKIILTIPGEDMMVRRSLPLPHKIGRKETRESNSRLHNPLHTSTTCYRSLRHNEADSTLRNVNREMSFEFQHWLPFKYWPSSNHQFPHSPPSEPAATLSSCTSPRALWHIVIVAYLDA